MTAYHLEILVEEESMEAFLQAVLPRLLPTDRTFSNRSHSFVKFREAIIEATA